MKSIQVVSQSNFHLIVMPSYIYSQLGENKRTLRVSLRTFYMCADFVCGKLGSAKKLRHLS